VREDSSYLEQLKSSVIVHKAKHPTRKERTLFQISEREKEYTANSMLGRKSLPERISDPLFRLVLFVLPERIWPFTGGRVGRMIRMGSKKDCCGGPHTLREGRTASTCLISEKSNII
jgi:hypothetical protein